MEQRIIPIDVSKKPEIICVDDTNRPNEVPTSRWVEKGKPYTLIAVVRMNTQGGIAGCKIEEINNDDLFPYTYFRLNRFGITEDEINRLVESGQIEEEVLM